MAAKHSEEAAAAAPEVRELPCRLSEAAGEEAAKKAAAISGKDVNDIFLVDPSLADLQQLVGGGSTHPTLLLRAFVRTEVRQHVFTSEQLDAVSYKELLPIYAECIVQYHAALKDLSDGEAGKKIASAPKLLVGDSS